jgi:hypothetical protein
VPDAHLLRRAALSAEFALAQYLVKGIAAGNQDMIDEAESMLTALADDVAEHGGQPISVEPLPQPTPVPAPASGPASSPFPQTTGPDNAPVPAVSRVSLLAPDSVSGLSAVPSGAAMPAVQVSPIPLDAVQDDTAGGDLTGGGTAGGGSVASADRTGPAGNRVSGVSVTAIPDDEAAAGDSSGADTSTQSIAVIRADAQGAADTTAPADTADQAGTPADDTSTTNLTVVEAKSR